MYQKLKSLGLLITLAVVFLLFLATPLPLLSSKDVLFCRGLLLLLPFAETNLYIHQIFGETFTLFDPNRLRIIGVGLILLAATLGTGRFVFRALLRLFDPNGEIKGFETKERLFLTFLLGMTTLSNYLFWSGLIGWINRLTILPIILFAMTEFLLGIKNISHSIVSRKFETLHLTSIHLNGISIFSALFFLFFFLYLLAGTIPPYEYDMLEYHAEAAREIFETGRITFCPFNVYLNMPLGSEMFYLAGILLTPSGDGNQPDALCLGVTSGKFFLAFVPIFCAFGAALFTEKLSYSQRDHKLISFAAALSVLAIPEIFQVSANGLIDILPGLTVLGAVYTVFLSLKKTTPPPRQYFFLFLSGLFAGFSAACKYTAIPFITLPIAVGTIILFSIRFQRSVMTVFTLFSSAALISGGGWYLKNLLLTGNPFYPLTYSIFGDRTGTWDAAKNARWITAHTSHSFHVVDLLADMGRLVTDNFSSVLLLFMCIFFLHFFVKIYLRRENLSVSLLALYILFFFLLWWFSTHRLSRFLVPILPIAAILVTIFWFRGYKAAGTRILRGGYILLWILIAFYSLSLNLVSTPGILVSIRSLSTDPERYGTAIMISREFANEKCSDSTLLLVGEARAFAFRSSPILYNTCWDNSRLSELLPQKDGSSRWGWTDEEQRQIIASFHEKRVKSILVDYNEIHRFTSEGNYGLTDSRFAEPALFESLVHCGILKPISLSEDIPNIKYYRIAEDGSSEIE